MVHQTTYPHLTRDLADLSDLRHFSHPAMATVFHLFLCHPNPDYAAAAARAAFDELDRLEGLLSRFLETSDLALLAHLPPETPALLMPETAECLQLALALYQQTDGAFDPSMTPILETYRNRTGRPSPTDLAAARELTGFDRLRLDPLSFTTVVQPPPLQLDLGAIGKGYALDCLHRLLARWDIPAALLNAGASTLLPTAPPPGRNAWPLTITDPRDRSRLLAGLDLPGHALAGSGLNKGPHIIDPRTARPVTHTQAAWVLAPSGALADALATTFMIMKPAQVRQFCDRFAPHISALLLTTPPHNPSSPQAPPSQLLRLGPWPHTRFHFD